MSETPDWPAIVAALGADPGIVTIENDYARLRLGGGTDVIVHRRAWWPVASFADGRLEDTPEQAVHAALAWLRGELDRRITELQAARERLGGE
jgi:hypothetical protein